MNAWKKKKTKDKIQSIKKAALIISGASTAAIVVLNMTDRWKKSKNFWEFTGLSD